MNDKPHPNDMAHKVVPEAPTRITVSGGPKAEPYLYQRPGFSPGLTRLLLVLVSLAILTVGFIAVFVLDIKL